MKSVWSRVLLDSVAEITVGHVGPMASEYVPSGVPFLRSQNVERLQINTKDMKYIAHEFHQRLKKSALSPGDVVIVRTGKPGTCAVVPDWLPVANCSDLVIVRCGPSVDPHFLAYYVNSSATRHVDAHLVGAVQQHFNVGAARTIRLLLPPLVEQGRLVAILRALDEKIELNRQTNETLEAMARALFKSWFVDFDPVRAKAEGRQPTGIATETASLFPSELVDSELGPIPKGWRVASVGEFVELQRGTTYKSALKGTPGPVLLGLGAIARNGGFRGDNLMTYGGPSPEKLLLRPGDLFVSLKDVTQSADLLGAVARVPPHVPQGRLTQDTVKLVHKRAEPIEHVLYRTLLSPAYREYCRAHATGTTNLGLSREDFLAFPVIVSPAPILALFNSHLSALENQAETRLAETRSLAVIRDALLPRLLSGELPIPEAERLAEAPA